MSYNYDYMIKLLPWWLSKNENVQAIYKAIALCLDNIDATYHLLDNQHLVDYANGEFLDDIGVKFGVDRNNNSDKRYRNRIKLAMKKTKIVPNIDTLVEIGKMFTGIQPLVNVGFEVDGEPGRYDIQFIGDKDYDFTLIDDLDYRDIVGGGIKINTQKCIESYTTSTHFGGIFLGQSHMNQKAMTTPICDFSYIDTEYFGNEQLGENTVQEKIIKLGGL